MKPISVITYLGGERIIPIRKSFRLKSLPQCRNACSITLLKTIIGNSHCRPYLGLKRNRLAVLDRQSLSDPHDIYDLVYSITKQVRWTIAK